MPPTTAGAPEAPGLGYAKPVGMTCRHTVGGSRLRHEPLASDPFPTGRRASTNPDRRLRLSWARSQMPGLRTPISWEAPPHTTSGSSFSSHSRQIHTSPRLSRALSAAGTIVTPQAGQMGGCSSSSTPQSISARGWDDPGGGTHPHRRGDREGTRSAGYACLSRPSRPGPARGAPAVLPG